MRYLPLTDADRAEMLAVIGAPDVEALYRDVPADLLIDEPIGGLPMHMGEMEVEQTLGAMAAKNMHAGSTAFFVGGGLYRHHVPASVDHLIQRGEFLTSYTPYQPEVSQGTLQSLFEFQTMVAAITGMEVANASMYDGATAAVEAVLMACRVTRRHKAVLAGGLHPHYGEVIATYARTNDIALVRREADPFRNDNFEALIAAIDEETACVVVQNPDVFGRLRDLSEVAARCAQTKTLMIAVVTEVVSLGAVVPPGAMGADIVACEGQSIGVPLNFGGPTVGLMATRERLVRQMPGRLAGQTVDADGRRGYVLTLAAREQHIRRERATSNICTNSGLCALAFTIHMALLGEDGFRKLAALNHAKAVQLEQRLAGIPGVEVLNESYFNEFTLKLPWDATSTVNTLIAHGVLGGVPLNRLYPERDDLDNLLLVAATETNSDNDIENFGHALEEVLR